MPVLKPLLPLFLLSAAVSHLFAQTYGKITGAITDASGAVVEGARVSVRNTATSQVREALTNQTGVYDVPFLVPGSYVVRVEKQGFKSATRSDVLLQVGDVARVDFTVDVGVVTESVEVQGGSALLTTETTSVGTVIENRRIVELPLDGRNYLQDGGPQPERLGRAGTGRRSRGAQGR